DVVAGEAEIVRSRQVLEEAVIRVGVTPEAGTSMGEMISKMQLALTVAPAPGSNVLQISYLGRYPDRAARLVNTLTDVYVEHHNRAYANEGIQSFYAGQLHIPYSEEYRANPTIQTFKDRLAGLEIERYQALQRYQPDDRHVRDKEEEIANVRARLGEEKERVLNVQTVQENQIYRDLQRNVLTIEASVAELREREAPMAEHVVILKKQVHELRDQRFMINNLKQVADEKAYAFDLYWRKQEEARISEAMKNQSMVNVTVVERATPPIETENGLLLPLLMGLMSGLVVGA